MKGFLDLATLQEETEQLLSGRATAERSNQIASKIWATARVSWHLSPTSTNHQVGLNEKTVAATVLLRGNKRMLLIQ